MADLQIDLAEDIPDGWVPLEMVAVFKCLDDSGDLVISVRTSKGLMTWEAVGMLIAASDMARADILQDFKAPNEDED